MKTENQTSPTGRAVKAAGVATGFGAVTLGLVLRDKKHSCCVLDATGKVLKKETITNERAALEQLASEWPGALS